MAAQEREARARSVVECGSSDAHRQPPTDSVRAGSTDDRRQMPGNGPRLNSSHWSTRCGCRTVNPSRKLPRFESSTRHHSDERPLTCDNAVRGRSRPVRRRPTRSRSDQLAVANAWQSFGSRVIIGTAALASALTLKDRRVCDTPGMASNGPHAPRGRVASTSWSGGLRSWPMWGPPGRAGAWVGEAGYGFVSGGWWPKLVSRAACAMRIASSRSMPRPVAVDA